MDGAKPIIIYLMLKLPVLVTFFTVHVHGILYSNGHHTLTSCNK